MSKNILITEGDEGRTFTDISRLFTPLSNGSMQAWIPDDEYMDYGKFSALTVVEEGTYTPTTDGYLNVVVEIPETTSVRGIQDGTTVEYSVDSLGYLIFEEVD